jgi:hypothetical protein
VEQPSGTRKNQRMSNEQEPVKSRNRGDENLLADREELVPTARAIQPILAARSTCERIANAGRDVVEAMEATRSLAPRPRTNLLNGGKSRQNR